MRPKSDRNSSNSGPMPAHNWLSCLSLPGQFGGNLAGVIPSLFEFGLEAVNFGRSKGKLGPLFGRVRPKVARNRPDFGVSMASRELNGLWRKTRTNDESQLASTAFERGVQWGIDTTCKSPADKAILRA